MCAGLGCIYEKTNGECRVGGGKIPSDAACQDLEVKDEQDNEPDWDDIRDFKRGN